MSTPRTRSVQESGNSLRNLYKRLADLKNLIIFLNKCLKHNLTPKYIQRMINCKNKYNFNDNVSIVYRYKNLVKKHTEKLVRLEIKNAYVEINKLDCQLDKTWLDLQKTNSFSELNNINIHCETIYKQQFVKKKRILEKKFLELAESEGSLYYQYIRGDNNRNYLVNLTSSEIPEEVTRILNMGPKFAYNADEDKNILRVISDSESILKNFNDQKTKNELRKKISYMITNYRMRKKRNKTPIIEQQIIKDIKATKRFKKENEEHLVFLEADKGNKTVIMKKAEYNEKMQNILDDQEKYKKLGDDSIVFRRVENSIKNRFKILEKKSMLSKEEIKQLQINVSYPGKIYGTVKIHKPGNELRPIITSCQTPNSKISKYLASILKTIVCHDHRIKNSIECIDTLNSLKMEENEILCSLDIKNLFPQIPIDIIVQIIEEKWETLKNFTNLDKDEFLLTFNTCINSNIFMYKQTYYKQISGTPIGNPLSSVLADLLIDHIYTTIIEKFAPKLIWFYVDDSLAIIEKTKIDNLIHDLNKFHSNIVYTYEKEQNNSLNFLDIIITKSDDGYLRTNLYEKPSKSDRVLNFLSQHPPHQKRNIVANEVERILKLVHPSHHQENIQKVKEKFQKNGYPDDYLNITVRNTIQKHTQQNSPVLGRDPQNTVQKYGSIVYIPSLTETIKRILAQFNICLAMKPQKPLATIVNNKTPVNILDQCNLVYQITCESCAKLKHKDTVYIGQTKRKLRDRLREHFNSVTKKQMSSALAIHAIDENHEFCFENPKILCREENLAKREFLESHYIMKNKNSVNFRCEKECVSLIYSNILSELKA